MNLNGLFVIFRESSEQYLHTCVAEREQYHLAWCAHPRKALTYGSQATATEVAQRLADHNGCGLTICVVEESDRQVGLVEVGHVWPRETPPID